MIQKLNEAASVILAFDHKKRKAYPQKIFWHGQVYTITQLGLHHSYRQGRTLYHVFSVASPNLFFRLVLNTDTLFWKVEEISDGNPN